MEVSDPFDRSQPTVNLSGERHYAPAPEELKLSGIWLGSKPRAVINNTVVGVGMTVSGYRVQKITQNKVVLSRNGQQRTLTVRGGE
jgi:type II secretory pathway component PulC